VKRRTEANRNAATYESFYGCQCFVKDVRMEYHGL